MAGFTRGPPRLLATVFTDSERMMKVDFDRNDGGLRGPEDNLKEIDYADELLRDDWRPVRPSWHGQGDDPLVGIDLDADPVARLLLENVAIWRGDLSRSFAPPSYDVTPWVTSAAEILERLVEGKPGDRRRAEGCPTSVAGTEAVLRRVIPTLLAAPRRYWDPTFSARSWERHVYGRRKSPKAYGEAVLHAELWRDSFYDEELFAFVALDPSDRHVPRNALDLAVYRHVTFPDGFEPVMEDPDSFERF